MCFSQSLRAQERTSDQIAAARDFRIEGVSLGMTQSDFIRLYPKHDVPTDVGDIATNTIGLCTEPTKNTDGISAAFWKEKLLEFYVFYSADQTDRMGGGLILAEKLSDKYGKPDADSPGKTKYSDKDITQLNWTISDANLFVELEIFLGKAMITVRNISLYSERERQKKQNANPGF